MVLIKMTTNMMTYPQPQMRGNIHQPPYQIPSRTILFSTSTPSSHPRPPTASGAMPRRPPTPAGPPPSCAGWRIDTTAPAVSRSCPMPSATRCYANAGNAREAERILDRMERIGSGPIGSRPISHVSPMSKNRFLGGENRFSDERESILGAQIGTIIIYRDPSLYILHAPTEGWKRGIIRHFPLCLCQAEPTQSEAGCFVGVGI